MNLGKVLILSIATYYRSSIVL